MLLSISLSGLFLSALSILQSAQASPTDVPRVNGIQLDPSCDSQQANLTRAIRSAQSLAYSGLREAFAVPGTVYEEYFPEAERRIVKRVFQQVLGATRQQGTFPINVTCLETQECHSWGLQSLAFVNHVAAPDTINICRALLTGVPIVEQNPCFNPKQISWAMVMLHELLHVHRLVGLSIWDVTTDPTFLWNIPKGITFRKNHTGYYPLQAIESVQSYVFMACESFETVRTAPGECPDWKAPLRDVQQNLDPKYMAPAPLP